MLNLLEKFGGDKPQGIELGDIEWYHRLRNTLYHDGNGVTVDPEKVDAYNQIANLEAEALKRDPKARARLAGKLLTSLEELSEQEVTQLWAEEAQRRAAQMGADPDSELPAEDVLRDAWSSFK